MKVDMLFEVSSEAGNKVGGIYTVLQSKSAHMKKQFGEKYCLIGFYNASSAKTELAYERTPRSFKNAFDELKKEGIICYYGTWRKGDNARLILIDATDFMNRKKDGIKKVDQIKGKLWEEYKIDSLMSYAAGMLIEKLSNTKNTIAHFHEWIAGAGLLYLKMKKSKVKTVFTTHATTLGRTKAAYEKRLMGEVDNGLKHGKTVDTQEAFKYKLEGKHLMEKVCAQNADAFTTVSKVVGKEAQYILGVKPKVITENALDFDRFGTTKDAIERSKTNRKSIEKFLFSYFLPYYPINCSESIISFISGRYEFENKGIDIFIESLGKLNKKLSENSKPFFAFIFVPAYVGDINKELLSNVGIMDQIIDNLDQYVRENRDKIVLEKKEILKSFKNVEEVLEKEKIKLLLDISQDKVKKDIAGVKLISDSIDLFKNMKRNTLPHLCTFEIKNHDLISDALVKNKLDNRESNKVKIIFYPTYLRPGDGLLNMSYYDVISGMDLGVFPSRYEPWGYTPVESAALMNIAVTSDMAGYGQFVVDSVGDTSNRGLKVLKMVGKQSSDVVNQLTGIFYDIVSMSDEKLLEVKKDARKIAEMDNWSKLIKNYIKTYELISK
jgi:glycogen(starch) synthase